MTKAGLSVETRSAPERVLSEYRFEPKKAEHYLGHPMNKIPIDGITEDSLNRTPFKYKEALVVNQVVGRGETTCVHRAEKVVLNIIQIHTRKLLTHDVGQ